MSAADPVTPEPHRVSLRLPRPLWIGAAAGVLVIVAIGLQIGVPIWRQHVVVREVERAGGTVAEFRRRGPEWLLRRVNSEWMAPIDEVIGIDLRDSLDMDAKLDQMQMGYLDDMKFIWLENSQLSDSGLARLKTLTSLQCLLLTNTQVTDVGLSHLHGLASLQGLHLDGTKVTDAGVAQLAGLSGLVSLRLDKTQVTDRGIAHLTELIKLESLGLSDTEVTDRGLRHLQRLTNLKMLDVDNTRVTDGGIADLKRTMPWLDVR